MDDWEWKTLLKWMIWGKNTYFWKHPIQSFCQIFSHPPHALDSTADTFSRWNSLEVLDIWRRDCVEQVGFNNRMVMKTLRF